MREKKSIKERFDEMEVGAKIIFPAERLKSIRQLASEYGFMSGRKYRVNTERNDEGNRVIVTRLS